MRVCNVNGCPNLYPANEGGRCPLHRREADRARGNARDRGYSSRGHQAFRSAVLSADPICVACNTALSTVADHYPLSRRELVERGMNPNDPQHGRGLCHRCHSVETARNQPGGWNSQDR